MTVAKVEQIVKRRYTEGARQKVEELCCPIDYDPGYLQVIPEQILARDYGCGDPCRHVRPGETKGSDCSLNTDEAEPCGLDGCC